MDVHTLAARPASCSLHLRVMPALLPGRGSKRVPSIHIYTIRACIGHHPECFPARLLARPQLVSCRALNALAWSNYIRIHQEHGGGDGVRTHIMPPPLRVGSTEDGSAANVHKKRCNESRSSAEGGRDPLPLLSARQAFLHAHRRYLRFMGAPFRYQCNSCGHVESALSSCSGVDIVLTRCDRPPLKLDHR